MAQVRTRKRKVVEKGGFTTKTEAYKAGVAAYNDYLHGNIGITSEKITLREFMTAWLDNFVAMRVKPSTMQTYQSHLKNHILPYLGEVKVQELTPAMLNEWIRKLTQTGLSRGTLTNTHTLIYSALKYAVYPTQLIQSNPAAYIEIPKNAPKNIVKRHIITPEQFSSLLEKYPFGTPLYIPLLLLYHTGARISEILGLSWQDVDFAAKQINLHRQIIYIAKRGFFFTTLKTESSNRYVVVGDFLLGELKRWQQQTENEKLIGGSYVHIYREADGHIERRSKNLPAPDGEKVSLVCTRDNGQMILKNHFSQILKREGLNAHSFRHTHATRLIELGAKPTGVAGRLGHANVNTTQNLYTHNTQKLQEDTAAIFNENLQTKH